MAASLVVFNEVIGASVFLHNSDPYFFHPDHVAKATILAGQLGSFLEDARLSELAREEQRRAGILAEVAQSLISEYVIADLDEAVAYRLLALYTTPLLCISVL